MVSEKPGSYHPGFFIFNTDRRTTTFLNIYEKTQTFNRIIFLN